MKAEKEKKQVRIQKMIEAIESIMSDAKKMVIKHKDALQKVHPQYQKSAQNLLHYLAFRRHNLRSLQRDLGHLGLSRLAKLQSHVLASLQVDRDILTAMANDQPIQSNIKELSFKKGSKLLKANTKKLLGKPAKNRQTRIMVTMPSEAADDFQLVYEILESGMNVARINCAHDGPEVWKKMIDHVKNAAAQLGKDCKIAMDLAGPKIRTGSILPGPRVRKIRPPKDIKGNVVQPVQVWLGPTEKDTFPHVPIAPEDVPKLLEVKALYFRDTRGKKRALEIIAHAPDGVIAQCKKTTFLETGLPLFPEKEMAAHPILVGDIPALEIPLLLKKGDQLRLDKAPIIGKSAVYNQQQELVDLAHVSCTAPAVFDEVKVGERVLFDDGKIAGVIEEITENTMLIHITYAATNGSKLRADKGINFPDSKLTISGLTTKDIVDLQFVAAHADIVNFSFVNRPEDVTQLLEELENLAVKNKLGIILKIETLNGFNQLSKILLEAMQVHPIGVMIARGDLAIECGWNNIGRIQEEILSLCQAAHITDIWATQVLEGLAKNGIPSRSEISDAVMSQRADCVMLNKGPHILEAIRLLDMILSDMDSYQEKNAPFSPALVKTDQ